MVIIMAVPIHKQCSMMVGAELPPAARTDKFQVNRCEHNLLTLIMNKHEIDTYIHKFNLIRLPKL
jgi:hypothetical protein